MNIAIFGPPLSGKGTHTGFLQNEYGFDVVSTGALLRQHVKEGTDLGKRIKGILDAGDLIAVDDVMDVIAEAYSQRSSEQGIVFDGTPRRVDELNALNAIMGKESDVIDCMIVLDVPEDELYRRMEQRKSSMIANGDEPRSDDDPDVLRDRLLKYADESEPVIAAAEKLGIHVIYINGNQSPEIVQNLITEALQLDDDVEYAQQLHL